MDLAVTAGPGEKPRQFRQGRSAPLKIAPGTTVLSLLTLNLGLVALSPFGFRRISFASHLDERLAAAPSHLSATGADVIALQEVYTSQHRRFLQESLIEFYPYSFAPRNLRSVLGSGLMFLSRHPIRCAEFVPRHAVPVIESAMSEKGCLCIDVEMGGAGVLRLINVHMTVGGALLNPQTGESNVRRVAEIDEVLAVANRPDRTPALLLGDFNCSPIVSPEIYGRIMTSGYIDAFAAVATPDHAKDAVTWDRANPLNVAGRYRNSPSQRIDHVFVPASIGERVVTIASTIEFSEPTVAVNAAQSVTLSDHYGLLVRLAVG